MDKFLSPKQEKLIIFSAPSGAGKTTIVKHILNVFKNKLSFSISATTRNPRGNEINNKDYYFIAKEDFLHKVAKHEFVEFEEVYEGTFYGTLKSEIQRIWNENRSVVFDIDVQGGLRLKKKYKEKALSIFVMPPSLEILEQRLRGRGTESEIKIEERILKAKSELEFASQFDITLLNNNLQDTCLKAEEIIAQFLQT